MQSILIHDSMAITCKDGAAKDCFPKLVTQAIDVDIQGHGTSGLRICRVTNAESPYASLIPCGLGDKRQAVDDLVGIYGANQISIFLGHNDNRPLDVVMAEYEAFVVPFLINIREMEVIVIGPLRSEVVGLSCALQTFAINKNFLFVDPRTFVDVNDPDNFVQDHLSVLGHQRFAAGWMGVMQTNERWPTV